MFQLLRSHHQAVYMKNIKANHTPLVYIQLKMISGKHPGLTNIATHEQAFTILKYCIKLNN